MTLNFPKSWECIQWKKSNAKNSFDGMHKNGYEYYKVEQKKSNGQSFWWFLTRWLVFFSALTKWTFKWIILIVLMLSTSMHAYVTSLRMKKCSSDMKQCICFPRVKYTQHCYLPITWKVHFSCYIPEPHL